MTKTTPPISSRSPAPDGGLSHNQANLTTQRPGLVILPGDFDVADTTVDGTLFRFDDNDSGKFSYISPRFAGFQVGLSYIPNFESGGDNNNSISRVRPAAGGSKTAGGGNNGAKDGFAVGTNFTEKFGDVGLKASLGYLYGDMAPNEGSSNLQALSGGMQIALAGFTIGGSYTWANGDKASQGGGNSYDGYGYDAGVAYSTGPYKIGLGVYERRVGRQPRQQFQAACRLSDLKRHLHPRAGRALDLRCLCL
ncbi:MAG: porin [Hyphomicrobiales bacterium]|nr:porin [Hyphomicrobiales bacterium]